MGRRTFWLPFLLAAVLAPVGCFRAYNPTYFPNWGFGGDIVQTHAKPAGRAYFKNFDPFACRIDLTPGRCTNAINSQQVLIATVVDGEGKPRRSRRVEWILDGPGHIVEVDESGLFAGRGYKVDNSFAVSYTDYKEHTITRGNDDPRDDFTIYPGQTWCVVSCAVPGETVVTAYAPEVHDWRNGRITSRLTWSDTQFNFPPPVVSRAGGEAVLSTEVIHTASGEPAEGLRVRYRILDGAPAVLASRSGAGTTAVLSGAEQKEAEVIAGSDGAAAVAVVQPNASAGTTRVAVEVVKPDPNGSGPGTVVGRKETTVEWATSDLSLDVEPPKLAGMGRDTPVKIVLANGGKADSPPVTVTAAIPEGAEFVRSDPPVAGRQGRTVTWAAAAVPGGKSNTIELVVKPTRTGSFVLPVAAETPDKRTARREVSFSAEQSSLSLAVDAPKQVATGGSVPVKVTITNPGPVPLDRATIWVAFDDGLTAANGKNPVELNVEKIPANGSKSTDVMLSANKSGDSTIRVNVVGDGGLNDRAEAKVSVRRAEMTVSITGPEKLTLGESATWNVVVVNAGDAPLSNVSVRATLPRGLTAATASGTAGIADVVLRDLGTLAPGARANVAVAATADQTTDSAAIAVSASSGEVRATGQTSVAITGQAALTLDIADPAREVPVGRRGVVKLTVSNRGNGPATRVEVSITGTEELTLHGGQGPGGSSARVDGKTVTFPMVESIAPGTTAEFLIDIEAAKAGPARLTAEARADHLTRPLRDEQPVRVVAP